MERKRLKSWIDCVRSDMREMNLSDKIMNDRGECKKEI
jgi:hypothetical protein